MLRELVERDARLLRFVSRERPDVLTGIGGIFAAHTGWMSRRPSVIFYDTEHARAQNALTYPFATEVVVPRAYSGWTPRSRTVRYAGYHELSYLHPNVFKPSRERALAAGLSDRVPTFLVRTVAWSANHDVGDSGLTQEWLAAVVKQLERRGKVIISAEGRLPKCLESNRYRAPASELHHVMAFCTAYVGESATMASESVVLGIPSVYIANVSRGYLDEQSRLYGLLAIEQMSLRPSDVPRLIDRLSSAQSGSPESRRRLLLADTQDVASVVVERLEHHGASRGQRQRAR